MADNLLLEIGKAIKENEDQFLHLEAIDRLRNETEYLQNTTSPKTFGSLCVNFELSSQSRQ